MHNKSISGSLCDAIGEGEAAEAGFAGRRHRTQKDTHLCHIAKHKSEHLCQDVAFNAAQITQMHKRLRMDEAKR